MRITINFFLLLFLVSCGSQTSLVKHYYVIEFPDSLNINVPSDGPFSDEYCELSQVNILPAYSKREIAVRNASHQVQYYTNHEWAVNPESAFTEITLEYLKQIAVFRSIEERYWDLKPRYRISISIYNLEAVNENNELKAHLRIDFNLINQETNKTIIHHNINEKKVLGEKEINELARVISREYFKHLEIFTQKITNFEPGE